MSPTEWQYLNRFQGKYMYQVCLKYYGRKAAAELIDKMIDQERPFKWIEFYKIKQSHHTMTIDLTLFSEEEKEHIEKLFGQCGEKFKLVFCLRSSGVVCESYDTPQELKDVLDEMKKTLA